MAQRALELTLISGKDLKDVNLFSAMEVYAVVSLSGDPRSRQRVLGDRDVGEVHIPLSELLSGAPDGPVPVKFVAYQVRKIGSGKPQGVLNFSYKLGEVTQGQAGGAYGGAQAAYAQPPPAAAYPPQGAYPPAGKADAYGAPSAYPPPGNAGLLGGALGGLLIGDMISDSAGGYDAGYDAGFDDGGGFDF
ncbi:unnamed protein product [Triticum turgidum subsp. durum]|uniref:C2 domain-containing protein n=1 Tax=Triticum turgidum subsp. durum TaxID=4567 RepID=A0A9R0RX13_TRITD|nr:unnamed protein product [Triticum turgidum subsp. durum]